MNGWNDGLGSVGGCRPTKRVAGCSPSPSCSRSCSCFSIGGQLGSSTRDVAILRTAWSSSPRAGARCANDYAYACVATGSGSKSVTSKLPGALPWSGRPSTAEASRSRWWGSAWLMACARRSLPRHSNQQGIVSIAGDRQRFPICAKPPDGSESDARGCHAMAFRRLSMPRLQAAAFSRRQDEAHNDLDASRAGAVRAGGMGGVDDGGRLLPIRGMLRGRL